MVKEAAESLNPKFRIDVSGAPWASYASLSHARKLPMYTSAWGADYADLDDFVLPFLSSKGTFAQIQGYKNLEADRLIEAAAKETNQGKRRQIYFRLQEIAFADVPAIYIVYPTDFVTMRSWVKGWYSNPAFPTVFGYFYTMSKSKN
jgi:peptide/nickel transport system substrate-binding protein